MQTQLPDKLRKHPVFEHLQSEKERTIAYEAYLALYLISAVKNHVTPPPEVNEARSIDDILDNARNEELLTTDRDPDIFGGVTVLASLRAYIEQQIREAKASVHDTSHIPLQKKEAAKKRERAKHWKKRLATTDEPQQTR